MNSRISRKTQKQMFLLLSGGHICAPNDGHQRGVNIQSVINLCKTSFFYFNMLSCLYMNYRTDLILGEAFCILASFISQILDFLGIDWFAISCLMAWQWKQRIAVAFACLNFSLILSLKEIPSGKCDSCTCILQMNLPIKRFHYIFNKPQYVSHKGSCQWTMCCFHDLYFA